MSANGCNCDFCAGKKNWNDNWCPRCSKAKLEPPKRWEDMDVCDKCARQIEHEAPADAQHYNIGETADLEPRIARGDS